MRKFTIFNPGVVSRILLFIFVFSILLLSSCRKQNHLVDIEESTIREQFFITPPSTSPAVIAIARNIQRQDNVRNFVPGLVNKAGFAKWDKAKIHSGFHQKENSLSRSGSEGEMIFIPFVAQNDFTTKAILIVKIDVDTLFRLVYATQYTDLGFDTTANNSSWTARDLFHAFIAFDNEIFGHTRFIVSDGRLLNESENDSATIEITNTGSSGNRGGDYTDTVCIDYTICHQCPPAKGASPDSQPGNCCFPEYYTTCITYWFEDDDWGWYYENGSGGGGGAGGPCENCNWEDEEPCPEPGQPVTEFCGDNGWEPEIEPFDPYEAPPVILDTSIINNFPCVQTILDSISLYFNANAWTQLALYNAFGIQKKMNIKYTVDWSLTKDSLDGHTRVDLPSTHEDVDNFYATVNLNPWVLANSTHEYIAATIIHESIHAFVNYKYWQYSHGHIDSTTFKTLFPLFWPRRTFVGGNTYILPNNFTQHNAMAGNLVSIMSAPLALVNSNPRISTVLRDSINRALSWGGLQGTTVWNTKNDTCNVRAINTFARDTTMTAPFMQASGGCALTSNNDSKTLHMKRGCQ